MNKLFSYGDVAYAYGRAGYKFYDNGKYNINLFGIRNSSMIVDEWNDLLCVAYRDEDNTPRLMVHKGSTKPGLYWLKTKLGNINGTAILMPGQYPKCWQIGFHNNQYLALTQKGMPFRVWRDADGDSRFDYDGEVFTDVTGLNMHTESYLRETEKVGMYSAGCQVRADNDEHDEVMAVCQKSAGLYGSSFTYALFTEQQFYEAN